MSLETTIARISYIQSALAPPPAPTAPTAVPATGGAGFAGALQNASASSAATPLTGAAVAPGPAGVVAAARGELGVAEEPPGSNDGARIKVYRSAVGNAPPGPWCAYFTSWCARQAGVPIGENGQGFGSVDAVWAWAQQAGKAIPASSGQPQPGDLIVWDEHIGVVEAVLPDGRVQTIEGNSSDKVSRRVHARGDAIGYVRLG